MHGTLTAHSAGLGKGSRFVILLKASGDTIVRTSSATQTDISPHSHTTPQLSAYARSSSSSSSLSSSVNMSLSSTGPHYHLRSTCISSPLPTAPSSSSSSSSFSSSSSSSSSSSLFSSVSSLSSYFSPLSTAATTHTEKHDGLPQPCTKRLLLVEDNKVTIRILRQLLQERMGYGK